MKKKKIIKRVIVLLCIFIVLIVAFFTIQKERKKREEWVQQQLVAIDYREQNRAFPRVSGHPIKEEYYVGYDAIDEPKLYVCLSAYNEWIQLKDREQQKLTLEDVEEYLSSEYNEDGSLRIQEGYENIRAYVDWYYEEGGGNAIAEYWEKLDDIAIEYRDQNSEFPREPIKEMNVDQLQELIKKKNAPSYEINVEVMCGSN